VHKDSIAVAVAEQGRLAARLVGTIGHDVAKLCKVLARLILIEAVRASAAPISLSPSCTPYVHSGCCALVRSIRCALG
jgi:hypothetical protein